MFRSDSARTAKPPSKSRRQQTVLKTRTRLSHRPARGNLLARTQPLLHNLILRGRHGRATSMRIQSPYEHPFASCKFAETATLHAMHHIHVVLELVAPVLRLTSCPTFVV